MSLFESIYVPTAKDLISGIRQNRFYFLGAVAATAAAQLTVTLPAVPPDTARFLTGFSALAVPGAAQNLDYFQLNVQVSGANSFSLNINPGLRIAAGRAAAYAQIDVLALATDVVTLSAIFDAGAAANTFNVVSIWGYDVPRANIV